MIQRQVQSTKVVIEDLWRIKLSHLKPLLDAAKALRELPQEEQKCIAYKWQISYSKSGWGDKVDFPLSVRYHFKPRISSDTGQEVLEEAILFQFTTPDGEEREVDIELEYRESNLHKGYREYYFRDRHYNLCRTLYSDGRGIYSRQQLQGRLRYHNQNSSRKMRELDKHQRADNILSSLRGRHFYWKGQPTPILKQALKAKELRDTNPNIYALVWEDRRKGRKPKAPNAQSKNIAIY